MVSVVVSDSLWLWRSVLSNEAFDSVSGYIIIDKALCGKIITGACVLKGLLYVFIELTDAFSLRAGPQDCGLSRVHRGRQVPPERAAVQHRLRV